MNAHSSVIVREPEILGGTPCFRGTRVPLKNLIDYIEGGYPLAEFLEDFPSVSLAIAIQALEGKWRTLKSPGQIVDEVGRDRAQEEAGPEFPIPLARCCPGRWPSPQ